MVVKMAAPGRSFGGVADYCLHDPRMPREAHHPESAERVEWNRVPLCSRALEVLDEARTLVEGTSPFLFPNRVGKQLEEKQATPDVPEAQDRGRFPTGFRSSFRDWAAEETDHPRDVIEAALAHVVRNKVEAAYRRTDLFERRRRLMNDWAAYLADKSRDPEAGPIR